MESQREEFSNRSSGLTVPKTNLNADDTVMYLSGKEAPKRQNRLNADLLLIRDWFHRNVYPQKPQ